MATTLGDMWGNFQNQLPSVAGPTGTSQGRGANLNFLSLLLPMVGNPKVAFGLDMLQNVLRQQRSESRRPAPPTPWSDMQSGQGTAYRVPRNTSEGIIGAEPGQRLPVPSEQSPDSLAALFMEDQLNALEAQRRWNERVEGGIEGYADAIGNLSRGYGEARQGMGEALASGRVRFASGQAALASGMEAVVRSTASVFTEIRNQVNEFKTEFGRMASYVEGVRGEVMQGARNNAAQRLVDETASITFRASETIAEAEAGMRAAGIPEGNIQDTLAKMSLATSQQLGDVQSRVLASENERLSALDAQTGSWVASMASVGTKVLSQVRQAALQGGVSAVANMQSNVAAISKASADLDSIQAQWETSTRMNMALLATEEAKYVMQGRKDIVGLLGMIRDPVMELGPIIEGAWGLDHDLEIEEYQLLLADYDVQNMQDAQYFSAVQNGYATLNNIGMARHEMRAQQTAADQQMAAQIGAAVVTGGMGLAGAGILAGTMTAAAPVASGYVPTWSAGPM